MTRIDLRAALDVLPRYRPGKGRKRDTWCQDGPRVSTNARLLPDYIDKLLVKIVRRYDDTAGVPIVKWVDVTGDNVWVLHRTLKVANLMWLYRHLRTFQKLPFKKLPIYIFYKGRIVVWNGTHRMTLGRLMQKKIRARVIDLDRFLRDEKKGLVKPNYRVITVKPKKKVRRGKAKH